MPPTDKHVEDAEAPTGYEQIIWDYVSDMEADIERGEMDQQEVVDHVTAEFEQYHLNGPADVRDGAKVVSTGLACWESISTGQSVKVRNEF